MRIVFCVPRLGIGGAERRLVRLVRLLRDAGAEPIILSTSDDLAAVERDPEGDDGLDLRLVSGDRRLRRWGAVHRLLDEIQPDRVVGWTRSSWIWGYAASRRLQHPANLFVSENSARAAYSPAWRVAMAAVARRSQRIVANSRHGALDWQTRARGVDVRFAPNPLPVRTGPLRFPDEGPVRFAMIARPRAAKGIDVAIDALDLARRRGLDATLDVIGPDMDDGTERRSLVERAQSRGVGGAVDLTPRTISDLSELESEVDVVVAPSRWEGSSNVVIEALAAGFPVVASDAVELPWDGVVFPRSPAADAAGLADLLVERAWEETKVAPGAWESWDAAARTANVEAWLG